MKTTFIRADKAKSSKPNPPKQTYQTEQNISNQTFQSNKSKEPKLNSKAKLANLYQARKVKLDLSLAHLSPSLLLCPLQLCFSHRKIRHNIWIFNPSPIMKIRVSQTIKAIKFFFNWCNFYAPVNRISMFSSLYLKVNNSAMKNMPDTI